MFLDEVVRLNGDIFCQIKKDAPSWLITTQFCLCAAACFRFAWRWQPLPEAPACFTCGSAKFSALQVPEKLLGRLGCSARGTMRSRLSPITSQFPSHQNRVAGGVGWTGSDGG